MRGIQLKGEDGLLKNGGMEKVHCIIYNVQDVLGVERYESAFMYYRTWKGEERIENTYMQYKCSLYPFPSSSLPPTTEQRIWSRENGMC